MQGNRDDVVSSFVRMKIREWRDAGRELQELARLAGVAKSSPSQALLGTGIGSKTGPRYAKAFGYASYDALKVAAWKWWQDHGRAGAEMAQAPETEALQAAMDLIVSLGQGSKEQLETILAAYAHPRFRDRDRDWWLRTLLDELGRDRATARDDKRARAAIAAQQSETRSLRVRRRAPHETPSEAPKRRERKAAS